PRHAGGRDRRRLRRMVGDVRLRRGRARAVDALFRARWLCQMARRAARVHAQGRFDSEELVVQAEAEDVLAHAGRERGVLEVAEPEIADEAAGLAAEIDVEVFAL